MHSSELGGCCHLCRASWGAMVSAVRLFMCCVGLRIANASCDTGFSCSTSGHNFDCGSSGTIMGVTYCCCNNLGYMCSSSSDCGASAATNQGTGTTGQCSNTCSHANDNDCDDGGTGSQYQSCAFGTDCVDCGDRSMETTTAAPFPTQECISECSYGRSTCVVRLTIDGQTCASAGYLDINSPHDCGSAIAEANAALGYGHTLNEPVRDADDWHPTGCSTQCYSPTAPIYNGNGEIHSVVPLFCAYYNPASCTGGTSCGVSQIDGKYIYCKAPNPNIYCRSPPPPSLPQPPTPFSPSGSSSGSSSSSSSTGIIIGAVMGAIIVVGAVMAVIAYCTLKNKVTPSSASPV